MHPQLKGVLHALGKQGEIDKNENIMISFLISNV